MKKKVLILQFRDDVTKDEELELFIKKSGLRDADVISYNTILDEIPQNPNELLEDISCVVTGGSGQYDVTKNPEPIILSTNKTKSLFDYIFAEDIPLFGVCFSHQKLAQVYGGKVEADSNQAETGTRLLRLSTEAFSDPLFSQFPQEFKVVLGHKDSVTKAPVSAKILGSTQDCPIQILKYKNNIYTSQFHPELDRDAVERRLCLYPEYLGSSTLEDVMKSFDETPEASKILQKFIELYHN